MTGNAPTHTCSYFCDKPECIKAQRDELRDKLAALEKPVPVEPDVIREKRSLVELHGLGGSDKEIIKHIDALKSALQHITEDKERLYQLNVDCEALIIRQREERKKQQERAEAAESALQRVTEERDIAVEMHETEFRKLKKAESLNKRMVELLKGVHASDCATHNMPAMPNGPCNCGIVSKVSVPCGCYTGGGCECGKYDEAASDGYAHGWNDAIEAMSAELLKEAGE